MKYETALKRAGSINKLAALLGVTRQAVQHYRKQGEIPEGRLVQLRDALVARKAKR